MQPASDIRRFSRERLMLAGMLAVTIAAAAIVASGARLRFESARERLRISTDLTVAYVEDYLGAHRAAIASLADLSTPESDWTTRLAQLQSRFPAFATLTAIGPGGDIHAGWPPHRIDGSEAGWSRRSVEDRDYFREAVATRRPFISNAFRGRGYGTDPIVAVSAPLLDADGHPAMVLNGALLANEFLQHRAASFARRDTRMLILDRASRVVYASPDTGLAPLDRVEAVPGMIDAPAHGQAVYRERVRPSDPGDSLVAVGRTSFGWTVALTQPVAVVYAEIARDVLRLSVPALLAVAVVVWAASALASRLTRPLRELSARMRAFAFDQDPHPIDYGDAPTEVAELGDAFNHLAERLGGAYRDVQQALAVQERLRAQLEETVAEREQEIARRTGELRLANDALRQESLTDELTGIGNYRSYRLALDACWLQSVALAQPLAAICVDVDYFKSYNDSLGHPAGDRCLRRVARILHGIATANGGRVARSGGEEFVTLLPDCDRAAASGVAETIRAEVEREAMEHADSPFGRVTVSVGCASLRPHPGGEADALIAAADQALYQSKRDGRNRVACVDVPVARV